ncbi:MAG: hypothetical protein AAF806_05950, partial [Bacteroidota bacterium]
ETIGRLLEHYYEINEGIGVHKPPQLYGAFPTDAYSHTPANKGAQQPGMTGQVKEDILSRFGELGVFVKAGQLQFHPVLLKREEFISEPTIFNYIDIHNEPQQTQAVENSLCFTYCQVPIIYTISDDDNLIIKYKDETAEIQESLNLDANISQQIFKRTGEITQIKVSIRESELR